MSLLKVEEAQKQLLEHASPLATETVGLVDAFERVIATDVFAKITQPPFHASSMDGYAVSYAHFTQHADPSEWAFEVVGVSRAGHVFSGQVHAGQAVRIFTGAALPEGTDTVLIQENCTVEGDSIVYRGDVTPSQFVRPAGYDFLENDVLVRRGTKLNFRHLNLIASMNVAEIEVYRKPSVAILATGDELVLPGDKPQVGQIVSSIPYGMKALVESHGGCVDLLGVAADDLDDLKTKIARADDHDILVTIGGASVGDHDLVQQALIESGMTLDFWRIAMRPGKPLMVGQLKSQIVVGVPGNPVSALICCFMFVCPVLRAQQGLSDVLPQTISMQLETALAACGPRQHYMRAFYRSDETAECGFFVRSLEDQDSSLQATFAEANCLIVRPPHAKESMLGEKVEVVLLQEIGPFAQ